MAYHRLKLIGALLAALACVFSARADVIETRGGARLVGVVTALNGGSIVLETDYAGPITIKQSEVVRIETDKPLVFRLAGGTTMEGTVSATPDGRLAITGQDGTITTTVDKVAATWAPGQRDPAVAQLLRRWRYEASLDVTGKTGNSEQLGYGGGVKGTLSGPEDTLILYSDFSYQRTNGVKSQDRLRVGFDYSSYLTERVTWYARDEGGYDNVKDIVFYNVAAAGLGYDFIKNPPRQKLTGRTGISYRFEDYGAAATDDVRSAGLDLGLAHVFRFENAVMNNNLTFVPAFDDFANYRAVHDSNLEFPLSGNWKFRVGVNNDYTSRPSSGVEKLDTTYYGRFVLNWD
jgi:hypothetical protein